MDFLLSVKLSKDAKFPTRQEIKNEHDTLNFVRGVMLIMQPMEETSADLKAINFLNKVKANNPMMVEHPTNGNVLVVQIHGEK